MAKESQRTCAEDVQIPQVMIAPVPPAELAAFKRRLGAAFDAATRVQVPGFTGGAVPEAYVDGALASPGAEALDFVLDGRGGRGGRGGGVAVGGGNSQPVGGAVVSGDDDRRELEFLFVDAGLQGRHLGTAAWRALEARYLRTRVWTLVTPYRERRNVNFYVNVCGFAIVEYINSHHASPDYPAEDAADFPGGDEGLFRFEKVMPAR
jgi:hypothetical protein